MDNQPGNQPGGFRRIATLEAEFGVIRLFITCGSACETGS